MKYETIVTLSEQAKKIEVLRSENEALRSENEVLRTKHTVALTLNQDLQTLNQKLQTEVAKLREAVEADYKDYLRYRASEDKLAKIAKIVNSR